MMATYQTRPTLKVGADITAKADVVDGIAHYLILRQRRRRVSISWLSSTKLALSQGKRSQPQIRRAYAQWLDLAGGDA
jgi:hypothetical protein